MSDILGSQMSNPGDKRKVIESKSEQLVGLLICGLVALEVELTGRSGIAGSGRSLVARGSWLTMISEIPRFVFRDHVVETLCEERKKSVVFGNNSICQAASSVFHQMGVIHIESGKLVRSQPMDLRNVVFIGRNGTGGGCA